MSGGRRGCSAHSRRAASPRLAGRWRGSSLGPDLATLRARLEHEPFAAALAAGRTLTVDQALDEALADAPPSREGDIAARPASR